MKLKYYLRGLATGLVIATLILTIANRENKPLTDAQIRQRAMELGMIDSDSRKLSSLQGGESQDSNAAEPGSSAAEPSSTTQPGSSAAEPNSSAAEPSSTTQPGSSAAESSSSAAEPNSSAAEPSGSASGAVTIYIPGGATSYTVSQALAAAGLVADAKEYDTFLCDNGYAHTIRVGTYEILPGTSEEEIAKMIAR